MVFVSQEGVNATDPSVYSQWQLSDLETILRGDNGVEVMLLDERLDCVRQVGKKLVDKYQGNVTETSLCFFGHMSATVRTNDITT